MASSSSSTPQPSSGLSEMYTVVRIYCYDKGEESYMKDNVRARGTGFFINRQGVILTSTKFIPGDPKLYDFSIHQFNRVMGNARLLIQDSVRSLALMEFKDKDSIQKIFPNTIPYLKFGNSKQLTFESTIHGIGCHGEFEANAILTTGVLSSKNGFDVVGGRKRMRYHTTCPMNPGCEGAPIFNDKNEVVGVFFDQISLNVEQPHLIAIDGFVQVRTKESEEHPALSIRAYRQNSTRFITTEDITDFICIYIAALHPNLILTEVGKEEAGSYTQS